MIRTPRIPRTTVALCAGIVLLSALAGTGSASAAPTVIWIEDFESGLASGQVTTLDAYGYDADAYWGTGANCNGIVLDGNADPADFPDACESVSADPEVAPEDQQAMSDWAEALGGADNHAVSNFSSNAVSGSLVVSSPAITVTAGQVLEIAYDHYADPKGCGAPPTLTLQVTTDDGKVHELVPDEDICENTDATSATFTVPAGVTSLTVQITNSQTAWQGNDFAYDNLRVLEVAPPPGPEPDPPVPPVIPNTGAPSAWWAISGTALAVAGAALVVWARRRAPLHGG